MTFEKVDPFLALLLLAMLGNVFVAILRRFGWKDAADFVAALSPFAGKAAYDALKGEKTQSVQDLIRAVEDLAALRGWSSSHSDPQIVTVVQALDQAKKEHS